VIGALTLAARLVLAAVFAVAGAAKLRDRRSAAQAAREFGVPKRLAGPVGLILPLAELTVAGLLLFPGTVLAGEAGALALLLLFSAAIGITLARGHAPDCHCFGRLHSAPASWRTLVRNGLLAAVAALALSAGLAGHNRSVFGWIGRLEAAEILALTVTAVAVVLLAVGGAAFLSLLRSYGKVLVRLEQVEATLRESRSEVDAYETPAGLEPGSPAPTFELSSVTGEAVSLGMLLAPGRPLLLLFTSPSCGPCKTLLPTAVEWQREHAHELTIAVASGGAPDDVRAEAEELGLRDVLVDEGLDLYRAFQANGTPSAVLVTPDGRIGSRVASGSEWIQQLFAQTLEGDIEAEQGLPLGTKAPALELRSLEGETVSLASLRGRDALLLFWNPGCGFCRAMHDDLVAWESSANGVTPRLVVVSSGDEQSTRAEGFRSLVLLDDGFAAGSALGAQGTPMAVLLDAEGRIASSVAAGAEAVLSIASTRRSAPGTAAATPEALRPHS
jgi:methylamine dehydrogenase accessory protein MauD